MSTSHKGIDFNPAKVYAKSQGLKDRGVEWADVIRSVFEKKVRVYGLKRMYLFVETMFSNN